MKPLSLFIMTIILFTAFTGCRRKCVEFNNDILTWMPYKLSDNVILSRDSINESLIVTGSRIEHTNKIGHWVKCDCGDSYIIELSSDSMTINIIFDNSYYVENSWARINYESLGYSEQFSTYQSNGKTYSNVIAYKNNSQNLSKRFDMLLISKSIGIIGIIGVSEEWHTGDDTFKSIDVSMVDFKESNC